jgi:hypothetical protein
VDVDVLPAPGEVEPSVEEGFSLESFVSFVDAAFEELDDERLSVL